MLEADREFEISNFLFDALDFSLGAFDWRQANQRAQIDEEHRRYRHHQLAHMVAVEFGVALHGQPKTNQAQDDKDDPVHDQEDALAGKENKQRAKLFGDGWIHCIAIFRSGKCRGLPA